MRRPRWLKSLFSPAQSQPIRRRVRQRPLLAELLEERTVPTITTFQQGVNGYTGTQDVELRQANPSANQNGSGTILIDFTDAAPTTNASHGLLRFDNIFGSGAGLVPTNAYVKNAYLSLFTTNPGDGGQFYRMAVDWGQTTATWNSLTNGLDVGTDTVANVEGNVGNLGLNNDAVNAAVRIVNVTDSVRAWLDGASNFGWGIVPWASGTDGWEFTPSEGTTVANRPMLTIDWDVTAGASMASFQQGVNGYAGTKDTVIRQDFQTQNNATTVTVFSDAVATAGPDEVLLKFDNVFGSAAGQIPIGSTILSASLELTSDASNSQGDGGRFYRLLQPWTDTATWASTFGGNGIDTDDVEAISSFTTAAGNAGLNADPQSNHNIFDITSDLQSWSDGFGNNGWGIIPWPGGGDGWGLQTSESTNIGQRPRLFVEFVAPPPEPATNTVDFSSGTLSFSGGVGLANVVSLSVTGGTYTLTDSSGPITVTSAAQAAGVTGDGTNTVTFPSAAVNALNILTGTNNDTITVQSVEDPISVDGGKQPLDSLSLPNGLTISGDASFTRFNSITVGAGQLLDIGSGTLTLDDKTGLGTSGTPLRTRAGTVIASGGNGGVFIQEQDGATFTVNATGSGAITVTNLAGTLTLAGNSGSTNGAITLSSADGIVLNGNLGNASTVGRILINANTDGSGAQGFTDSVTGNILTANTGITAGAEAVVITVNTAGGGTGDAILGNGSAAMFRVDSNGGNILWNAGFTIPNPVGGANSNLLTAVNYAFTTTAATGSIGTAASPIQTNALLDTSVATAVAGSGGIFLTDWGAPDMTVSTATATGAGNVSLISANASGSNLTVGNVSTGSGSIFLAADDDLFINGTVGGPSFSGTVDLRANRDGGNEQRIVMGASSKIQTTNATASAVRFGVTSTDNDPNEATYGGVVLGNVIVGNGGTIGVFANDSATSDGAITIVPNTTLDAGANGIVRLQAGSDAVNSSNGPPGGAVLGLDPDPVTVTAGTVNIASTNTPVFVRLNSAANLTAVVTGVGDMKLLANQNVIIAGATKTGGGAIFLDASGRTVTVNAALGDASTGDVTVNASQITVNVPLTVPSGKNYSLNASSQVQLGSATVVNGTLTAASGVKVAVGGTLDGSGTITGAVAAQGASGTPTAVTINGASPGTLSIGGFTGSADTTIAFDIAGLTAGTGGYDQFNVTGGTVNLAGTTPIVTVPASFTPSVGNQFTLFNNAFGVTVSGQFAGSPTVFAANNPSYQFTATYNGGDGNDVVLTLSAILNPPVINVSNGLLTFTGGTGNNNVGLSVSAGVYTITDSSAVITLTAPAIAAGFGGSGTNTVTGPSSAVTGLLFNLEAGDDTITLNSAEDALTVVGGGNAGDTVSINSTIVVPSITVSGVNAITTTAAGLLQATTVNLSGTGIGTAAANVKTQATTLILAAGANGAFVTEADGAAVTVGGSGNLTVTNLSGTLSLSGTMTGGNLTATGNAGTVSVAGATSTGGGAVNLSSADGVTVAADLNAGAGTITIAANTDGAGTQGFSQTAGLISSTNSGTGALSITVNTAGGGTGSASIDNATITGRITVNANAGSVLYAGAAALSAAQQGTTNGGSAPARVLAAGSYVFSASGAGSVGTTARPIQTTNPTSGNTYTFTAGTGGIYLTDWGTPIVVSGATASGAGNVRIVTANSGGHNLTISGPVTTGSGSVYLAADDDFTLTAAIGGAGFSGTVYLAGNRDQGNGLNLRMNAGASITTSNATANAVLLDGYTNNGTATGGITLNNITVGNGGTITATVLNANSNGTIIPLNATVLLDAGANGTVILNARPYPGTTTGIGTSAAIPVKVAAGNVIATSTGTTATNGSIFITSSMATNFTASITGGTGNGGSINLTTTAGALTVAGATATTVGGIALTGASGVVLNATLGSSTTGAISITGPLSGAGAIALGTAGATFTQTSASTYGGAISGAQGVTKAGAGTLTLSGTSPYTGATAVTAGGLVVDGSLSGTSGVTVADTTTLGGGGTIAGPVVISGNLTPGGTTPTGSLGMGNLSFGGAGSRQFLVDLNGAAVGTGYDAAAVTGTVDLTGASLVITLGFTPASNAPFKIIDNNGTADAVTGTFAGLAEGAQFLLGAQPFRISYASGDGNDVVLTALPINAAPIITVPGPQTTPEDTDLVFSTGNSNVVSVADVDAGSGALQVTLTATNGVLTLATIAGLSFNTGDGTADATMTFTGTLAAINAALDGMHFSPTSNYGGPASVAIDVNDQGNTGFGGPKSDSKSVSIDVSSVNDVPVVTLASGPVPYTENDPLTLIDTTASVTDVDSPNFAGGSLTVDFAGTGTADDRLHIFSTGLGAGQIAVISAVIYYGGLGNPIGTFTSGTDTGTGGTDGLTPLVASLNANATPAAVEALIRCVSYQNVSDAPVAGNRTVRFVVDDGDGGTSAPATRAVAVTAVNDAPFTATPEPVTTNEDTPVAVTNIGVTDPDAGLSSVRETLTVVGGAVTLNGTAGLTVSGNGTNSVIATGTLAALTAALNGLTFNPTLNFNGTASIQFVANDLGNTPGPARSDTESLTIFVTAVNDAPVTTVPAAPVTLNEDTSRAISGISTTDVDSSSVSVTLSLSHGTLTLSAGSSGATVTGSGTASVAVSGTPSQVTAALAGNPVYSPTANYNGLDTLAVLTSDGSLTDTDSVTLIVNPVNDAPTLGGMGGSITFALNQPPIVVAPAATVADIDSPDFDLGTLTATITGGGQFQDVLGVQNVGTGTGQVGVSGSNVTYGGVQVGSLAGGTGGSPLVVTFNASATPVIVQAVADHVTFVTTGGAPALGNRVVAFSLTDGDGGTSGTPNVTINVIGSLPPIITLPAGTLTYTENDPATLVAPTATVTDSDSPTFGGGSLTVDIASGGSTADVLAIRNVGAGAGQIGVSGSTVTFGGTTIGTFTGGTAGNPLFVSFNASANPSAAQELVRNITFFNPSDNPLAGPRSVRFVVDDGGLGTSLAAIRIVTLVAVNDPPALTISTASVATNEDTPTTAAGVSVSDIDNISLSVTLSVAHGTLAISPANGASVGGSTTATVTISGTTAQVNATLAGGYTYSPAANYFGSDAVTISASDGSLVTTGSVAITVNPVNDNPTLGPATGTAVYELGNVPVVLAAAATAADIDSPNFDTGKLTVAVTGGFFANDTLALQNQGSGAGQVGVTGSSVTFGGTTVGSFTGGAGSPFVVTFNSAAAASAVQAVARAVTFTTSGGPNALGDRTVSFALTDGDGGSAAGPVITLHVVASGSPIISLPAGQVNYTENATPTLVAGAALVTDSDTPDFAGGSLTVNISVGGSSTDVLSIQNQGTGAGQVGVSGSTVTYGGAAIGTIAGGTGLTPLTVSFTTGATVAAVQAVVQAVGFSNSSDNPLAGQRTINFQLNDGGLGNSPAVTRILTLTAVNDPPANTLPPAGLSTPEDQPKAVAGLSVADPDAGLAPVKVTLNVTGGTVALTNPGSLVVTGNDSDTLTVTGILSALNSGLGSLVFTPATGFNGAATIQVITDDMGSSPGAAETDVDTFTITVTPLNDNPAITVPILPLAATEDTPFVVSGVSITDPDSTNVRVTFSVLHGTLSVNTGVGGGVQSGQVGGNGTASVVLTAPLASINTTLAAGGLQYTPAASYNGGDTISILVDDLAGGTAGASVAVNVAAANDAPTFTLTRTVITINEDDGSQIVTGLITGASPGPVDESSQSVSYSVAVGSVSGPLTFSTAPAISPIGDLTFTTAPNANGTAQLLVSVTDSGGAVTTKTVTLTVAAVNDPPVLTLTANPPAILKDAGPQTVPGLLAISPGPVGESGQTVSLTTTVTGTTGGLTFSSSPSISSTGTLTYTAAAGSTGTATVSVQGTDNGGGTNTSSIVTFTIVVSPVPVIPGVNTPPTASSDSATVRQDGLAAIDVLANDTTAPDVGETLTITGITQGTHGIVSIAADGKVTYKPATGFRGADSFTYTISDGNGGIATGTVAITVTPVAIAYNLIAVGSSIDSHVRVYDALKQTFVADFFAFGPRYPYGVKVGVGDVNGDGVADVLIGAGNGGGPRAMVIDGTKLNQKDSDGTILPTAYLANFFAYDSTVRGGVNIASGDVNGDGKADVIVGPGVGGGPHVKVFDGAQLNLGVMLQSFFAYDSSVRTGLSVAAADLNGDGFADIITGAGNGSAPHVKAFDGRNDKEIASFFAYSSAFTGGVNVSAGDWDGDGVAEIITGAGAGGGPHVKLFTKEGREVAGFLAFKPASATGIDVAYRLRSDGAPTITVSELSGIGRISTFKGPDFSLAVSLSDPDPGFLGGVEVG